MSTDHITWRDGNLVCGRCGDILHVVLPMAVSVYCELADAYIKIHEKCEEKS